MTNDIDKVQPEQPLQGARQQQGKVVVERTTGNTQKYTFFFVGLVVIVLVILLPLLLVDKDEKPPVNDDCETATELIMGNEPVMGPATAYQTDPPTILDMPGSLSQQLAKAESTVAFTVVPCTSIGLSVLGSIN